MHHAIGGLGPASGHLLTDTAQIRSARGAPRRRRPHRRQGGFGQDGSTAQPLSRCALGEVPVKGNAVALASQQLMVEMFRSGETEDL